MILPKRVLEITPKVFGVFPDEIRQRCARACLFCHVVLQPSFAQNRIPDRRELSTMFCTKRMVITFGASDCTKPIFQTWALVEGGAGKTAVLIFTMPIWTLLLAWFFLGERIRGKQWLAAASTLTGLHNCHRALGYEWQLIQQVSWRDGCNMLGQRHDPNQTFVLSDTCRFVDTDGLANDICAIPLFVLSFVIPEHSTNWSQ